MGANLTEMRDGVRSISLRSIKYVTRYLRVDLPSRKDPTPVFIRKSILPVVLGLLTFPLMISHTANSFSTWFLNLLELRTLPQILVNVLLTLVSAVAFFYSLGVLELRCFRVFLEWLGLLVENRTRNWRRPSSLAS